MITANLKRLKEFMLKGDATGTAAALLIALAIYFFLQSIVEGLIAPVLAAPFGEPSLHLVGFTVNGSEFAYGTVLIGLIVLILAGVLVAVLSQARLGAESGSMETRACPECTISIPVAAKRCPHCTGTVDPLGA